MGRLDGRVAIVAGAAHGERATAKDLYADDLVGTLVYLCSADSDAVTGQVLVVDHGAIYN